MSGMLGNFRFWVLVLLDFLLVYVVFLFVELGILLSEFCKCD